MDSASPIKRFSRYQRRRLQSKMSGCERLTCEECGTTLPKGARALDLRRHIRINHVERRERYGISQKEWTRYKSDSIKPVSSDVQPTSDNTKKSSKGINGRKHEKAVSSAAADAEKSVEISASLVTSVMTSVQLPKVKHRKHQKGSHLKNSDLWDAALGICTSSSSYSRKLTVASARKAPRTQHQRKTSKSSTLPSQNFINERRRHRRNVPSAVGVPSSSVAELTSTSDTLPPLSYDLITISGDEMDATDAIHPSRGIITFTDDDKKYIKETLKNPQINIGELFLPPSIEAPPDSDEISGNVLPDIGINLESHLASSNQFTPPVECPHCRSKFFSLRAKRLLRRHLATNVCLRLPIQSPSPTHHSTTEIEIADQPERELTTLASPLSDIYGQNIRLFNQMCRNLIPTTSPMDILLEGIRRYPNLPHWMMKELIRSFCDDEVSRSETLFSPPSTTDREIASGSNIEELNIEGADFIEIPDFDTLGYEFLDP